MSKRILIRHREGQREIALVSDRRLLFLQKETSGVQAEQIYWGQVERIVKGMEAAFVRIGKDQTGFLPFSECDTKPRSGDGLMVQVKKPPIDKKAPYLSARCALPGRYVIVLPGQEGCTLSQKITHEEVRERMLNKGRALCPPHAGLILRTEAANVSCEEWEKEILSLLDKWREIQAQAAEATAPRLIYDREDALLRLIRDEHGSIEEIIADESGPLPCGDLPVHAAPHPFDLYSVDSQWEKAWQRKIWLNCGGYLVIDKTEALTVVDVNSGKFAGSKSGAEAAFVKLNLEAAEEIARLMRLRAMGGIILVDFVDMQDEAHREAVAAHLRQALADDPVKTVVHGFTSLGLMEITRKKTDAPVNK